MRPIPPLRLLGALLVLACGEPEPAFESTAPPLPFATEPLPAGEHRLVSGAGDTLRLLVGPAEDGRQLLVAVRPGAGDSTAVLVDAATKAPLESYRRAVAGTDTVTARVEYGRGFEGQARLTLTAPQGRGSQNLRTPAPALDAGQVPWTLAALPFGDLDSLHVNYVAPFEKRALAALLLAGPRGTIRIDGEDLPAWPVLLRVSGLEERAWFAAEPPHSLLRLEERTRRRTWTRIP